VLFKFRPWDVPKVRVQIELLYDHIHFFLMRHLTASGTTICLFQRKRAGSYGRGKYGGGAFGGAAFGTGTFGG